jgi:hypothetical protein
VLSDPTGRFFAGAGDYGFISYPTQGFMVQSQGLAGRSPIEVFGIPAPGVFPAPTRTTEGGRALFGVELPGTFAEGGLDIGPFENVGGTSGVIGPEGELSPFQAGSPGELFVPGGAAARGLKAVVGTRAGRLLFGKGGALNSSRFVRVGIGRKGGESVFRIAVGRTGRFKLDIVNFGQIPKGGP